MFNPAPIRDEAGNGFIQVTVLPLPMLLIEDGIVREALDMRSCIDTMHSAFVEESNGIAANLPRMRYKVPRGKSDQAWQGNIICGALPSSKVAAVRYTSGRIQLSSSSGGSGTYEHIHPDKRSWGLVLLSSLETGEVLAIIHDETLQTMRVGATTGAAVRALAKRGSKSVGILGSSIQAERNLEAICLVRGISDARVFSPNKQHRERFAEEMGRKLNLDIAPVDSGKVALDGADIILCATNSLRPVFDGSWLEEGQTLITLATTSSVLSRSEADEAAFTRSSRIVLNSYETAVTNNQRELLSLIESGKISRDRVVDLGDVLSGKKPGRENDEQILFYKSNGGVGIQFAAAGALAYQYCMSHGKGRELPSDWFSTPLMQR